jgi:hypothetical protein
MLTAQAKAGSFLEHPAAADLTPPRAGENPSFRSPPRSGIGIYTSRRIS